MPGTQQSITSLLNPTGPIRYIQVDMTKYKKCEQIVKSKYPHLEYKVEPQVVTSFDELNQVIDL